MNALKHLRTYLLVCSLVVVLQPLQGVAQQNSDASKTSVQHIPTERDGPMFLFREHNAWPVVIHLLLNPLYIHADDLGIA